MPKRYSEEELLDHLRELATDLESSPTTAQMNERGEYAADTYKRRFGSWNEALRTADLEVNRVRNIPLGNLLAELRRLADELDRPPMAADVREHGRYSLGPYSDRFDSWGEALATAGIEVRGGRPPVRENVRYLRANGPSPLATLPSERVTTRDKIEGAATFRVARPARGATVAYLVDEHDPESVLRVFFEHNPAVRDGSVDSLVQRIGEHGRSWRTAARQVLQEYD